MNRLPILAFCLLCAVISMFSLGCPYTGPQYPVQYGNATPTPPPTTAVTLTGNSPANYAFNPVTVTVAPGGSVTFVPPNGSIVATAPFAVVGTYHYHCIYHSPTCGTTSCSAACTGMAGVVYIP
jgi:hypothetical protein